MQSRNIAPFQAVLFFAASFEPQPEIWRHFDRETVLRYVVRDVMDFREDELDFKGMEIGCNAMVW